MRQISPGEKTGRVLLIGNFLSGYVANRNVCEELSDRLTECGWDVSTASRKLNRFARLADMAKTTWLKRFHYDVAQVDVFSGPAFFWAETVCWVLRRAGKPYVLTLHGGNLPNFSARWPKRVKNLLKSAAVVTSPSGYLKKMMDVYRKDIILIPNAIDIGAHAFRLRERPEPSLIWIRAFHDIYNPSLAPRVLARLRDRFPCSRLIMIGPDKEDGSFQRMCGVARDLNVAESMTVLKGVEKREVPQWLERGDIFLNTSNVDNTPVSVIEAMACGLCVITTDAGGVPYLVSDNHNALVVPRNDPDAMANAAGRILLEPNMGKFLSLNARLASEKFDWSAILPQWKSLLHTNSARRRNGGFA